MKHPTPSRCRFHPANATHWYCPPCQLPLCKTCKPYADQLPQEVPCPLCGGPMQETVAESDAPISARTALANAAGPPALLVAVGVGAIAGLGFGSLPGLLLTLPLGIALLYLMVTLARRSGEGIAGTPSFGELSEIDQVENALRLLPLSLPYAGLLLIATASGSSPLILLSWLAVSALLPATLLTATATDSPAAALNPASLQRVFGVAGRELALAAGLGAAAVVTAATASALVDMAGLPRVLAHGLLGMAAAVFAMAVSSWLGSVARSHRRMLDYPAGVAPIDRPRRPDPAVYEPAQLAADAETLLHARRVRDARRLLGDALTRYPDDPRLNERFDRLVSETARPKEFRNHLERRMQRLVRGGQFAAATRLWQRHSPRLDNWMPKVSETRYRLALELDEMGEHQTAFRLLISLPPDDDKFTHIAEAWMEAARILDEQLNHPRRAKELRQVVLRRFPQRARRWMARWQAAKRAGEPRPEEAAPVHG